jgi:hypothetical protein
VGVFVRGVERGLIQGVRGIGGCILRWRRAVVDDGFNEMIEIGMALRELGGGFGRWASCLRAAISRAWITVRRGKIGIAEPGRIDCLLSCGMARLELRSFDLASTDDDWAAAPLSDP